MIASSCLLQIAKYRTDCFGTRMCLNVIQVLKSDCLHGSVNHIVATIAAYYIHVGLCQGLL